MSKTRILKYRLIGDSQFDVNTVEIPASAKIKHVGLQASAYGFGVMAWAEVVVNDYYVSRKFLLIATGEEIPDHGEYMKTVEFPSGTIWHLYEIKE